MGLPSEPMLASTVRRKQPRSRSQWRVIDQQVLAIACGTTGAMTLDSIVNRTHMVRAVDPGASFARLALSAARSNG
jgi:hypothetical protein